MVSCRTVCDDRFSLSLPGLFAPYAQPGRFSGRVSPSTVILECLILGIGEVLSLRDDKCWRALLDNSSLEIVLSLDRKHVVFC